MIYAMSDIHGCYDELLENMKYIDLSGDNRIVFCGDYMDYGPKSGQVLRYIYDLQKKFGKDKVIVLKGNHESMFLTWIKEYSNIKNRFMDVCTLDLWLKTDLELGGITFNTLVSDEQMNEFNRIDRKANVTEISTTAVRMIMETSGDIVNWLRDLPAYYETNTQIFVHAGANEGAGTQWKWSGKENMLWKYPHTIGRFIKTIIAGHIGTSTISGDRDFHDIYFDGESHYFIDGTVYKEGKLLLLGYDEKTAKYYQIDSKGMQEVLAYKAGK